MGVPLNWKPGLLPGSLGGGAREAHMAPVLSAVTRPGWLLGTSPAAFAALALACDMRALFTPGIMMPDGSSWSAASPGVSTSKSSISSVYGHTRVSFRRERKADAVELIPGSGIRRWEPPSPTRPELGPGRCAMRRFETQPPRPLRWDRKALARDPSHTPPWR